MLPTTKSDSLLGETKGQFILNIAELTKGTQEFKGFSEELSLDFGEWSEATENCFRFHQKQDKNGDNSEYAHWWAVHFYLFIFYSQEDKISQYEAWKDLDLRLRREFWTEPTKFDMNHYATKYEAAKTIFELKALIKEQTLNGVKDLPYLLRHLQFSSSSLRYFRQAASHLTQPATSSVVRMATQSGDTMAMASPHSSSLMANQNHQQ